MLPIAKSAQLVSPYKPINGYFGQPAYFDGGTNYLTLTGDHTGEADSKLFTLSVWLKRDSTSPTTAEYIRASSNFYLTLFDTPPNYGQVLARGVTPFPVALFIQFNQQITAGVWHHLIISCDLSNSANRHVYLDGSAMSVDWATYTDLAVDHTAGGDQRVGNIDDATPGATFGGSMVDFYFNKAEYIDLSVSTNLEKFIKNDAPVYLGSDGSLPTGTAPIEFLSGPLSTWHTNDGSGDGFQEIGTLTDPGNSPSLSYEYNP